MLKLIDSHAHLNDSYYNKVVFEDGFFKQDNYLLKRVLTVGYDKKSILKTMQIIDSNKRVYGIIGCHPQDVDEYDNQFEQMLLKHASHEKVVAIGEIGLDFYRKEHAKNKDAQVQVFVRQLQLADRLNLPVVIHIRDAFPQVLKILHDNKHLLNCGGVVHCFAGDVDDYRAIKKLGLKFSVGGPITFKNAGVVVDVVKNCDINDLLIETDCPYLTPEPYRGRVKNQPIMVRYVFKKIAEVKNISEEVLADVLIKNTYDVFKKLN